MSLMHRLRQARLLARLVLAWLLLSLGVAVASPLVQPQTMQVLCSPASGGFKLITLDGDGAPVSDTHHLDCPLCLPLSAPPPAAWAPPAAHARPHAAPSGVLATAPAAPPIRPWQARAPPLS